MLNPRALAGRELGADPEDDAFLGEQRHQLLVPAPVLFQHQAVGGAVHALELLARGQAVEAQLARGGIRLLDEAGHADFKKLVEI